MSTNGPNIRVENAYLVETACAPGELCSYAVYAPQETVKMLPGTDEQGWSDPWARYCYGQPVVRLRAFSSKLAEYEGRLDQGHVYDTPDFVPRLPYVSHLLSRKEAVTGDAEAVLRTSDEFFDTHTLANSLVGAVKVDAKRIGVLGQLAAERGALWIPSVALATFMGELPATVTEPAAQA